MNASFQVVVEVFQIHSMVAYDFFLNYSTKVLTAAEPDISNNWFSTVGKEGEFVFTVARETNNTLGYVHVAQSLLGGVEVSGNGTLARIGFTVTTEGSTSLDLHSDILVENGSFAEISHRTEDGFFSTSPPLTILPFFYAALVGAVAFVFIAIYIRKRRRAAVAIPSPPEAEAGPVESEKDH